MQSDIVQRLRDEHARNGGQGAYAWRARELCGKAAAEITRLRAALRQIQDEGDAHSNAIATATLGGSDAQE